MYRECIVSFETHFESVAHDAILRAGFAVGRRAGSRAASLA